MALLYAFATGLGALMFWIMTSPKCGVVAPDILALLAADLIAMLFVWIYDIIYENVSVYDPYWSFAPPVMFTLYALHKGQFTLPVVLLLLAVLCWGIRLTCNWARSFKGMGHEDWRYAGYRAKLPGTRFELLHFSGFVQILVPGLALPSAWRRRPSSWLPTTRAIVSGQPIRVRCATSGSGSTAAIRTTSVRS